MLARGIGTFRIVEELVENSVQHANCLKINVNVDHRPDRVRLSVKDDGIGFDYDQIRNMPSTSGLRIVENRTTLLNGNFVVNSNSDEGTFAQVYVPAA